MKATEGRRWHPEGNRWSFPHSDKVLEEILFVFAGEELDIDPSLQGLISQNQKRKLTNDTTLPIDLLPTEPRKAKREDPGRESNFEDMRKELVLRKYSPKTIKAYIHHMYKTFMARGAPQRSMKIGQARRLTYNCYQSLLIGQASSLTKGIFRAKLRIKPVKGKSSGEE